MTNAFKWAAAAGVILGVGSVALGQGAPPGIPWSNAAGTGTFFNWDNGQNSTTNLFGSPILMNGTQFVFFPSGYVAQGENGTSQTTTDRFDVDLTAFAGYKFTEIRIETFGDYSITGQGSVNVIGSLDINELIGPQRITSDALLPVPPGSMPVVNTTGGVSGNFQMLASRDLTLIEGGIPFTELHISFTNNVIAISGPGGVAQIGKTVVGFPIAVTIIPEPGMIALLGLGGLVAMRRRR
ncbi:MAG: PEP-CTERM sorting domain-containing protein [Phycisphaerales bacterium]